MSYSPIAQSPYERTAATILHLHRILRECPAPHGRGPMRLLDRDARLQLRVACIVCEPKVGPLLLVRVRIVQQLWAERSGRKPRRRGHDHRMDWRQRNASPLQEKRPGKPCLPEPVRKHNDPRFGSLVRQEVAAAGRT